MSKKSKKQDFESAMSELEALVSRMESGDLTLEESLSEFEKGVQLTRICQQTLEKAEQKVKILTSQGEQDFLKDD
jgi:exodeoxyribonuclease VII small subunit